MSIVGYWKFNGNSNDYSGNGYNGTDTAITYSQGNGILGQGAGFNGSTSKIITSTNAALNLEAYSGSTVIICFNIHATPAVNRYAYIIKKGDYNPSKSQWFLRVNSSNKIEFATTYNLDSNYDYCISDSAILLNKWYVAIVRYNKASRTIEIYLNGNLFKTTMYTAGSAVPNANNETLNFGYQYSQGIYNYANMSVDTAIVYNTLLSVADVKNKYAEIKGFF